MARVLAVLFLGAFVLGAVYLWFLAPSARERAADSAYENGQHAEAARQYTLALRENRTGFSEERLLYKIGNSWRLQGERERALDFYMLILRKNPDSVYRPQIEQHLKAEKQNLARTHSPSSTPLDLSFLDARQELSLKELQEEKNHLYRQVVERLSRPGTAAVDYETLELYRAFQGARETLGRKTREESDRRVQRLKKQEHALKLVTIGFEPGFTASLQQTGSGYPVRWFARQNIAELLEEGGSFSAHGFFLRVRDSEVQSAEVMLPRLAEVFQKSKIILVFVDSLKDAAAKDGLAAQVSESVKWLECESEGDACVQSLREISQRNSIWQLNG